MTMLLRAPMTPAARRLRAYFAPVDRASQTAAVFDPARSFDPEAPPAPWIDLGWIANLRRAPATRLDPVRGGPAGAPVAQFRRALAATLSFDFRQWGKLQMALASGAQHMNVLAAEPAAPPQPAGGTPLAAIALLSGSTASELVVGAGAVGSFSAGDILAADLDYSGQTGYVGSGIAAAYVRSAADVGSDPNYIRRVTFNVARVASKTSTSLLLEQPLLGGAPPASAKVQKVIGFVDREGGSFFQEWSALFVFAAESGGRVCYYYPHLQAAAPQDPQPARETLFDIADPLQALALHAEYTALPRTDSADSEPALCYRSYFPPPTAALY